MRRQVLKLIITQTPRVSLKTGVRKNSFVPSPSRLCQYDRSDFSVESSFDIIVKVLIDVLVS